MGIAGRFGDGCKLSCAAHDMDLMLGPGYCGIEPGPVNDPPLLQRDDDAWELRTPGLTHQCLYFEQPHTFEQILFIQTAEPALVGHA